MEPEICLGGKDALRAWREVRRRVSASNAGDPDDPAFQTLLVRMLREPTTQFDLKALPTPVPGVTLPDTMSAASIQAACQHGHVSCSDPELLVSTPSARRYVSGARPRVFGYQLPEGSLCQLEEGVLIPSPGMTVLLMARELGVLELSLLLSELCGLYCLDRSSVQGFLNAPPLAGLEEIAGFLDDVESLAQAAGKRSPAGLGKVRRALGLAVERAASPAETTCALLLGTPRLWGGYGLPKPAMNEFVHAEGQDYVCDLVWPGAKVVLEYQGSCHKGDASGARDRQKANRLRAVGCEVFTAGKEDLRSLAHADELARMLSGALGLPRRQSTDAFRRKQAELRRVLLAGWWGEGQAAFAQARSALQLRPSMH